MIQTPKRTKPTKKNAKANCFVFFVDFGVYSNEKRGLAPPLFV